MQFCLREPKTIEVVEIEEEAEEEAVVEAVEEEMDTEETEAKAVQEEEIRLIENGKLRIENFFWNLKLVRG